MSRKDREKLYVVFTMDCLPAGGEGPMRGPEDWAQAATVAMAFAETLASESLGGTFFLAPQALPGLGQAAGELRAAGNELALLCHPQLADYQTYLGAYNFDRQREIVNLNRRRWEDSLGEAPVSFRPGFFSANDHTYHVLCMEGFRQSSCSLPGRMDNEQCSMWYGSCPVPHHADPLDRNIEGTMEFLELPVTSDVGAAVGLCSETYTPPHLRIEEPDLHSYARALVSEHLDRMARAGTLMKVVTFVTSNAVPWGQNHDPHVDKLHNLCATLREVATPRDMELCWLSMDGIHTQWDEGYHAARELGSPR